MNKPVNILNKVTLENLKKNRTRTVVTIIGIVLSVALITAVTTFVVSLQNYLIQSEIARGGEWHVMYRDANSALAQHLANDDEVKTSAVIQNVGYALFEDSLYPSKPYFFVAGLDTAAFDMLPITIIQGRLPQKSSEILVPEHIVTSSGLAFRIGDTLTLSLGKRLFEGRQLGQGVYFQTREAESGEILFAETLVSETTKTYTVVGICARPSFENPSAPGYTLITRMDPSALSSPPSGGFDLFVALKSPAAVYDYTDRILKTYDVDVWFNSGLLRFIGISSNENFNTVLYSLTAILIVLIMTCSILLIYNSFAISVSERSRQFGILSSVGATRKQLWQSVLFEGFCVGSIGIPLGLLVGIAGIGITLYFIGDVFKSISAFDLTLSMQISLPALVIAVAVGVITIFVSASIPAQRAMRKSSVDIIRQTDDVKITAKAVKTSRLTEKLFGLEGTLALKNFKRNKKRYRSTVISLFVSIVLFISASAFGMYLNRSFIVVLADCGYDIAFYTAQSTYLEYNAEILPLYDKLRAAEAITAGAYTNALTCSSMVPKNLFTDRYLEWRGISEADADTALDTTITLLFVDDATYRDYIQALGLSLSEYQVENGKLVAVANMNYYDSSAQRGVSYNIFKSQTVSLLIVAPGALIVAPGASPENWTTPPRNIDLTIVDTMPALLTETQRMGISVFAPYSSKDLFEVSEDSFFGIRMYFLSDNHTRSMTAMEVIAREAGIGTAAGYSLRDVAAELEQNRNLILVINTFIYGFTILIALITIANVFNTISTSIKLRRREFAMLRSVGMGNRSFGRMVNFECVFYGLKALLYGLPVAFVVTYVIYLGVSAGVDGSFILPWSSIGISVLVVFLVVFVTMLYATRKMKQANVIDALRDELA